MKTVVITGANRGIGLGFTSSYLKQGWCVIALTRNGLSNEFISSLSEEKKNNLLQVNVELDNELSINKAAKSVVGFCKHIDLFINNAGVSIDESFGAWTQAAFIKSYQVNAVAPALLIQALEYHFNENSKIIQMTSGLASIDQRINPLGPFDAYGMSKAAVNMLTRRVAKKFESQKITVCALSPGWVSTDMGGDAAPMNVKQAIPLLTTTIEQFELSQSGGFFDEEGNEIPW